MRPFCIALLGGCVFSASLLSAASASAEPAKLCKMTRKFESGWFVKISVSNEGATCAVNMAYTGSGKNSGPVRIAPTSGSITASPQHGKANLAFDPVAPKIEYTPTAKYVGADHFEIRYANSPWLWSVDVTVEP